MGFITRQQRREIVLIALPIVLLIAAAFALAYQFVGPAPPRKITMTTGSPQGAYHAFGREYAEALAKAGVARDDVRLLAPVPDPEVADRPKRRRPGRICPKRACGCKYASKPIVSRAALLRTALAVSPG